MHLIHFTIQIDIPDHRVDGEKKLPDKLPMKKSCREKRSLSIGIITVGDLQKFNLKPKPTELEELENHIMDETGGSG